MARESNFDVRKSERPLLTLDNENSELVLLSDLGIHPDEE